MKTLEADIDRGKLGGGWGVEIRVSAWFSNEWLS